MWISDFKNTCRSICIAALLSAALTSCVKEDSALRGPDGTTRTFALRWGVLPFEDEKAVESKSVLEDCLPLMSGVNLLVYDKQGQLVKSCSGYVSPDELDSVELPSEGIYDLYFFANVPSLADSYPACEEDLESFGCTLGSYSELSTYGIPMASRQQVDCSSSDVVNVWFRRLATRLEVSFDKSSLAEPHRNGTFLKSLRVCQGALDLYPFDPDGSRALHCTGCCDGADKALEADVDRLNASQSVFIYLLTNMQGCLLPQGGAQKDKTRENLAESLSGDELSRLTFVEARCQMDCDDWSSDDVVLRHYIGGSSCDDYNCSFDIFPNRSRKLRLRLCEDDPLLEPWRFEDEGTRTDKKYTFDKPEAHIINGIDGEVTVSAPFDFEASSSDGNLQAALVNEIQDKDSGHRTKTYRLSTGMALTGLLNPSSKAGYVAAGLVIRSLTRSHCDTLFPVRIYHQVFSLTLRRDTDDNLRMYGENPLGLSFDCSYSLRRTSDNAYISINHTVCTPLPYGTSSSQIPYPCPSDADNIVGSIPSSADYPLYATLNLVPQWDQSTEFYMGEGNEATFGPGSGYSPANRSAGRCILHQASSASRATVSYIFNNQEWQQDFSHTVNDTTATPKVFFMNDTGSDQSTFFSWGCPGKGFTGGKLCGSTGHNNSSNYSLDDFIGCPFYITNGCLQGHSMHFYTHKWNSSNMVAQVSVACYRPGRDLFEAESGSDDRTEVTINFNERGESSWGTTSCLVESQSYSYNGVNIIINGCSCWPGGSSLKRGVLDVSLWDAGKD